MLITYMDWIWHGEKVRAPTKGTNLTRLAVDMGPITDQSGNMHIMLRDVFGMHKVKKNNYKPQIEM
jgi:hypothetical protein